MWEGWLWEGWLWERWLWEGRRCKSQRVSSRTSLKPAWPSYILKTGWRPAAAVASYLMSFVMCFAHAGLSRVANSPLPQASSMDLNVSILLAGVPVLPAGVATLLGAGAAFAANGFEVGASADPVASAGLEPPRSPSLAALVCAALIASGPVARCPSNHQNHFELLHGKLGSKHQPPRVFKYMRERIAAVSLE